MKLGKKIFILLKKLVYRNNYKKNNKYLKRQNKYKFMLAKYVNKKIMKKIKI